MPADVATPTELSLRTKPAAKRLSDATSMKYPTAPAEVDQFAVNPDAVTFVGLPATGAAGAVSWVPVAEFPLAPEASIPLTW